MKKIVLILLLCVSMIPSAEARPFRRHHGWSHGGWYAADVTAGIIGTTAGVLLAERMMHSQRPRQPKPKVYVVEPEGKCYTVVSRKTGKITQECVENASSDIIYVD